MSGRAPDAADRMARGTEAETAAAALQRPRSRLQACLAIGLKALDAVLRRYYGVREYSHADDCALRMAVERTTEPRLLQDGTRLARGDAVGVLHLWNERLPAFGERGPDLRWAKIMRRRMLVSLDELARRVRADPGYAALRAFRGHAGFGGRSGQEQMRRVASEWGFEVHPYRPTKLGRLHDLGENLLVWGMVAVFNPRGLRRHRFWLSRYELWISRSSLLARYGGDGGPAMADDLARARGGRAASRLAPRSPDRHR